MANRKRTEEVTPSFENGMAKGWIFGVLEAFRINLDMTYDKRIDTKASKNKKLQLGRPLLPNEKIWRYVWTQGDPPAYSFARGHVFHDPPAAHKSSGIEYRDMLRRTIMILDARPDAGALKEVASLDDSETSIVELGENEIKTQGWVDFQVLTYKNGILIKKENSSKTQKDFVELLRTGVFD